MAGARSAVIQRKPSTGARSSRIRALVIMPRSPTSTTSLRPKRSRIFSICEATVVGSPVLPSKTSTATGCPSQPQKSDDNLELASLAVAAVAQASQGAGAPLEVTRRHVVEHEGSTDQVPLRQSRLDRALAEHKPIHGCVEFLLAGRDDVERRSEGGEGRLLGKAASDGELRARIHDASSNHGDHEITHSASSACDELVEAELA